MTQFHVVTRYLKGANKTAFCKVSPELLALLEKESKAWRTARLEERKVVLTAEVAKVDSQLTAIKG